MSLVAEGGKTRPLRIGDCIFVPWYHPPAPLVMCDLGLIMRVDRFESYYGKHELCHASISADHLAAGSDFCVKMKVGRPDDRLAAYCPGSDIVARAVDDGPLGIQKVREHVKSENHVYGCDIKVGDRVYIPESLLCGKDAQRIISGRRYDLFPSILAPVETAASSGRILRRCAAEPEDQTRKEGPLPNYIGRLALGGNVYAAYAVKVV